MPGLPVADNRHIIGQSVQSLWQLIETVEVSLPSACDVNLYQYEPAIKMFQKQLQCAYQHTR